MPDYIDRYSIEREARARRDKKIVAARESGLSFAEIARMFQMSGGNVKDRITRFHRMEQVRLSDDPFEKLSPKTLRLLQVNGLLTVEKILEAYHRNELYSIREFGAKRLREVEKWFPVTQSKRL